MVSTSIPSGVAWGHRLRGEKDGSQKRPSLGRRWTFLWFAQTPTKIVEKPPDDGAGRVGLWLRLGKWKKSRWAKRPADGPHLIGGCATSLDTVTDARQL